MINKFDYEFLTGTWTGPYGAAYNVVSEDCADMGLYNGWGGGGTYPLLTPKGIKEIEKYVLENNA